MNSTRKFILLLLKILFISGFGFGQITQPSTSDIYNDLDIPRLDITIEQQYLDVILQEGNEESDEEFPATFTFNSSFLNLTEDNIGFRLRGNTSRYAAKKSFKVSINSFDKGRDIDGFEKLNLNGEHNDPTIVRAKIGWDLMNKLNVPSSRANHVEFYINNEYRGLYLNVEHIDEEFVEERFGNKNGNLYKCLYPADLNFKGNDPNLYKEVIYGRRAYELKTNEDVDDYSGLADFIDILNNTSDSQFRSKIGNRFHVNSFLKALAVEVLLGHWDNYGMNMNNYYLYDNPSDGKFYYIPYDLDNTLGVDFFDVDWASWNIYQFMDQNAERPLVSRILAVKAYREEFTRIMDRLLREEFNSAILFPRIDTMKEKIQNAAEKDLYRTYDYGFTIEDFNTSFTQRLNKFHVRYGLKPYIEERYNSALTQLEEVVPLNTAKEIAVKISPNPSAGLLSVKYLNGRGKIEIFNLDGNRVFQKELPKTGNTFSLNIDPGLYIVILKINETESVKRKLVIK